MSRLPGTFTHWMVGTLGLAFSVLVIGVWTAIGGYGLTCEARWPLCDGAVFGLFPANFGSFVEWFHRLVAMLYGFAILGVTVSAWRSNVPRRVQYSLLAALALTPVQVVLGAETVWDYTLLVLAAHFGGGLLLLTVIVAGTVWTLQSQQAMPKLLPMVGLAAIALPLAGVLTPGAFFPPTTPTQVAYFALGTAAYVGLLAGTIDSQSAKELPTVPLAAGTILVAAGLFASRVDFLNLIVGSTTADQLAMVAIIGGFLAAVASVIRLRSVSAGVTSSL